MTSIYPMCGVAIDVVFSSLDGPDHIGLFHTTGIYTHTLCHSFDLVKVHSFPPKQLSYS